MSKKNLVEYVNEGIAAHKNGQTLTGNPYGFSNLLSNNWVIGWRWAENIVNPPPAKINTHHRKN